MSTGQGPPPALGLAPPGGGLLARRTKNRNTKNLALSPDAAKPGTLAGTSPLDLSAGGGHAQPVQVAGSSRSTRSNRASIASLDSGTSASTQTTHGTSPLLPTTPSLSSSSAGSRRSIYHNRLSEQLATLELGVEFKLDLRNEDLDVLEELGCGNGGTVSRALHVPTKAIMAKKVVHIATSESTRKQILRELQIMHDCSSPFIVSFYGAYLQDPHICMCMEFMDKGSLDNIYKKVGPIPEPILAKIALAVVSGLTYLYEVHKIMHRDVKPSNILLNSAGQIKICDFGVSGELINSVADTFVGTSTYMSPERISGDPYTVKSDVWSLGITLIELAIGRFPFSSTDDDDDDDDALSSGPEDDGAAVARLSLADVMGEADDVLRELGGSRPDDAGEDTLSPAKSAAEQRASIAQAERKRTSMRPAPPPPLPAPRARKSSAPTPAPPAKPKAKKTGVSLAGSGHQMSILELLQYIVNEPAPRLPPGRFSRETEEFVEAALRKEPVGWNVRKKGPLPSEVARPTPKELLEYPWMRQAAAADTDVEAWARTIP
ncbi:hypothetical protein Rhopal_007373-T1 [Rhodotorula paludigena]|uniref:Protein kinase domain-containing protein n=1 Tax=Rhodotorula paludigena TaxID=86838 RepID=A0AAV5GUU4_9BASI|nr:hypothetical protein Rhopal_007373-T1 [Rhodotorula paludigena]